MSLTAATPSQLPPAEIATHASDRVSDLIQKLVAAATAEVESAAHKARAQAEVEITELQRTIDRLRHELQAERERLKTATEALSRAQTAATRLNEELDAERNEKGRFAATLETVRLVISGIDAELHSTDPAPPPLHVAEADDELTREEIDAEVVLSDDGGDESTGDAGPDGHLTQLLTQIEEIYRSDLKSAAGTSEVVARLAANLEYARDAYARRLGPAEGDTVTEFDRRIAALLNARSDTPFGRHLAMAIGCGARDRSIVTELEQQAS